MTPERFIDLTEPFVHGENIAVALQDDLPVYLGHECYAYDLAIKSHTGTYFETSSHVFRDGKDTDSWSASDVMMKACVIRFSAEKEGAIDVPELQEKMGTDRTAGQSPFFPGDALLVATSGRRDRHFTREAAEWMVQHGVRLLGAELDRYDTGFVNPTGFFIPLFKAEIPIVANLANWDRLPEGRCRLLVVPLLVRGVCTVPARVIAILE
ncbi:MAG: cyclase family protein [Planctomycetota bacterium]